MSGSFTETSQEGYITTISFESRVHWASSDGSLNIQTHTRLTTTILCTQHCVFTMTQAPSMLALRGNLPISFTEPNTKELGLELTCF